jgi:hypothetical protein
MLIFPSMSEMASNTAPPRFARPLIILATVAGMLVAATAVLWVHYGPTVFYEMITAGIAACL